MLKLPKNVIADPKAAAVEALFRSRIERLRFSGEAQVTKWAFNQKLRSALTQPLLQHHLVRSLEAIGQLLDRELKGLEAVQQKAQVPAVARLSRLLLLANDGSDRFYHDVESLLVRHGQRTWACVLELSGEELGEVLKSGGGPAKALLIADRKALEAFLLAIV